MTVETMLEEVEDEEVWKEEEDVGFRPVWSL